MERESEGARKKRQPFRSAYALTRARPFAQCEWHTETQRRHDNPPLPLALPRPPLSLYISSTSSKRERSWKKSNIQHTHAERGAKKKTNYTGTRTVERLHERVCVRATDLTHAHTYAHTTLTASRSCWRLQQRKFLPSPRPSPSPSRSP